METITFNKEETNNLLDAISVEGEVEQIPFHEAEKSGRAYLLACSRNDLEERKRRAEIMRNVSRRGIF